MPIRSVVSETRADGSSGRRQEIRSWGRLRETTELDPSGRFHGRHVEYSLLTGRVKTEGAYAKGLPDGVWTTYGEDGQVQSRATYKLGRIVGPAIAL
jgi:antitoxin component YwqK of YwqJK toxin-antitoxin module